MLLNKIKKILWFSFTAIILSCSTIPSATISKFQSIEDIQPQWEPLSSFANGIDFFQGKVASPKIEFWALRINLSSPHIRIFTDGSPGTISNFVSSNNLAAGINATPYDENFNNIGLVVSDRSVFSPANAGYDALVFYMDINAVRAIIVKQSSIYSTENILNAVGGFHQILAAGTPAERTLRREGVSSQPHPRSAAGVSRDGSTLYLLVIDGRRLGSVGATELETALLLRALGSNDGLNLDGGGSSAMALRFQNGEVRVVNRPGGFGRERVVAACLGISLSREK